MLAKIGTNNEHWTCLQSFRPRPRAELGKHWVCEAGSMSGAGEITILPATPERWVDFETLMGARGGCGGCWCMLWRLSSKSFEAQKGKANRDAMRAIFESGAAPGLLAYDGGEPVGWCSLAPRDAFPRLETSRVLKPLGDRPVWSVTCFFIRKTHRRRGISVALLRAATNFVRKQGGQILEGYPIDPAKRPYPAAFAWTGLAAAFLKAGFEERLRRSKTRPIMRKTLAED